MHVKQPLPPALPRTQVVVWVVRRGHKHTTRHAAPPRRSCMCDDNNKCTLLHQVSWKQQPTQLQAQGTHTKGKQLPQFFAHRLGPCYQAPRPVSWSCTCIQHLGDASHTCTPSPEPHKECLTTAWAQHRLASRRCAHASLLPSCCPSARIVLQPPPTPQARTHTAHSTH